jgi:hypothetical protein
MFNKFNFTKTDGNSTITLSFEIDSCQEIVDEFITFMRGCGFLDISIYGAMGNAVDEYESYTSSLKNSIENGLYEAPDK